LVREVDLLFISKKVRIIGIAIIVGLTLVFFMGLLVSVNYVNKDFEVFNLISFILCVLICLPTFFIRKAILKQINEKNFTSKYFNAHIIAFALCDAGGLFCITTNLFVNQNIVYASAGFAVAILYMLINFPRVDDYKKFNI
jgi:hypothetical protein